MVLRVANFPVKLHILINKNTAATKNVPKKIAKVFCNEVILVVFELKHFLIQKKFLQLLQANLPFRYLKNFQERNECFTPWVKIKIKKAPAIAITIATNDMSVGFL